MTGSIELSPDSIFSYSLLLLSVISNSLCFHISNSLTLVLVWVQEFYLIRNCNPLLVSNITGLRASSLAWPLQGCRPKWQKATSAQQEAFGTF